MTNPSLQQPPSFFQCQPHIAQAGLALLLQQQSPGLPGFQVLSCQACSLIRRFFFFFSFLKHKNQERKIPFARFFQLFPWEPQGLQLSESQVLLKSGEAYDSSGSAQGRAGRDICGALNVTGWSPLDLLLRGIRVLSILIGCSGAFAHKGASASSVPHPTFWEFLSAMFSIKFT